MTNTPAIFALPVTHDPDAFAIRLARTETLQCKWIQAATENSVFFNEVHAAAADLQKCREAEQHSEAMSYLWKNRVVDDQIATNQANQRLKAAKAKARIATPEAFGAGWEQS